MANYNLETETTTHVKGMFFSDNKNLENSITAKTSEVYIKGDYEDESGLEILIITEDIAPSVIEEARAAFIISADSFTGGIVCMRIIFAETTTGYEDFVQEAEILNEDFIVTVCSPEFAEIPGILHNFG